MDKQAGYHNLVYNISRFNTTRFLSMGYLKDNLHSEPMQSFKNLKSWITKAVRSFDADTLSNVWKNMDTGINLIMPQ